MCKLKVVWLSLVLMSAVMVVVQSQITNLTLFEIYPCSNATKQTVSRFKSDIYAIKPSFENCRNYSWWSKGQRFNKTGLRVHTWITNSSITIEKAVVFVSRQGISDISSWAIPFQPQGFDEFFHEVNRTMCPSNLTTPEEEKEDDDDDDSTFLFYIDVFSSSVEDIEYWIQVDVVPEFVLELDRSITVMVGAASPQIFYFKFPDGSSTVTVEAETKDDRCVFFSVQKNNCPINDLLETARSRGIYQTMSESAFLTVSEKQVTDREFVVVVITTNYSVCHKKNSEGMWNIIPINSTDLHYEEQDAQNIAITIRNLEPMRNFVLPIFLPFIVFAAYVTLICLYAFVLPRCYFKLGKKKERHFWYKFPHPMKSCSDTCHSSHIINVGSDDTQSLLVDKKADYSSTRTNKKEKTSPGSSADYQHAKTDLEYTDSNTSTTVTRSDIEVSVSSIATDFDESNHTLPRMCKTDYRKLKKQYTVYSWNTFTVGIFYALPAFQLVLSEQQILNSSGDQDKCYYNFKCAHPLGVLTAFNNVWSNVGYVLLGALFFFIIWYRDHMYRKRRERNREYIDSHGVPQFYGIYYGMAIALIIEGFMSAFYHICPSNANFQFDTAFMFIIGGLFLVKLFQKRHPDINVNAFIAFFTFGVVIFMTLIGLYVDMHHPFATRGVIFVFTLILIFIFLASFYNFHSWSKCSADMKSCLECCRPWMLYRKGNCSPCCPRKKGRFFKLLIVALVNIIIAVIGVVVHKQLDIATCVLVFFVANLMLFLVIYVLQKLWYLETLTVLPLCLIVVTGVLWMMAFFFFMGLTTTDWLLTPAESRKKNHECALLGFYDFHDIWHFFSASAMFFSFSFLLTLDDGVQHTPREKLRIF